MRYKRDLILIFLSCGNQIIWHIDSEVWYVEKSSNQFLTFSARLNWRGEPE